MNKNIQHIKLFNKFLYCIRKHEVFLYENYVLASQNRISFVNFKIKSLNEYTNSIFYFDVLNFCFKLHIIAFYTNLLHKIILAIKFPAYCF